MKNGNWSSEHGDSESFFLVSTIKSWCFTHPKLVVLVDPSGWNCLRLSTMVDTAIYRNVWKLNNGHSTILYHLVLGVPYVQTDPIGEVWWFTTGEWTFKFHRIGHVSTTLRRFQELCFILFPEEILIYVKLIVSIFYYIPIHIYI